VSGALRETDSLSVRGLAKVSIVLGVVDACLGILAVSGAVDDVEEGAGEVIAVLVILLLLSTALPPILRRSQRPQVAEARRAGTRKAPASATPLPLAAEVLAAADRIESLNGDPGNRSPEIRRECERLRELARSDPR
jgi:hypothetical protein